MSRLRTYASMKSKPVLTPAMLAVYALVDQRADGRCEVRLGARCPRRMVEHHHVTKPRRSHHDADHIIGICRACHDRASFPFVRGRLQITPLGDGLFACAIVTAPDKFTYRRQGATP